MEKKKTKSFAWLIVLALIFVGTFLRVRVAADLPYDGDEAIAGLMARNIAFQGESPIFLYGEHYVGAAMQYVVALLFKVFGFKPSLLRCPEYLLTAVFLFLGFILGRKTCSAAAGLWTLLLLAAPPIFLTVMNLKSWGDYNETYCLGGFLWWLTLVLTGGKSLSCWKCLIGYLFWGLAFGLGFWIHFPILIYTAPCGLWLLLFAAPGKWIVRWSCLVLGFFIGWGPALWYNITNDFANLGYASKGSWDYLTRIENSARQLTRLIEDGIPFLLCVESRNARFIEFHLFDPLFAKVAVLTGFAFLSLLCLYHLEKGLAAFFSRREDDDQLDEPKRPPDSILPLAMIVLVIAFAMYGRWGGGTFTPRYYSFAYLPLFVIAGHGLAWCAKRFYLATALWVAFFLYSNLYGHVTFINHPPMKTAEKLVSFLKGQKIPAVFTDYWIAHNVTFLTNERIIGSVHGGPTRHERYTRYTQIAEEAEEAAFALYNDHSAGVDQILRTELGRLGVGYEETAVDNIAVFYNLTRKVNPDEINLFYNY